MKLELKRYSETKNFGGSTQDLMFIDGAWECHALEDEHRDVKIPGETRIPAGTYSIRLRKFGRHHDSYSTRFPWHKGMLEIVGVPGFTDILIHIGNEETDTDGCVLVGDTIGNNQIDKAVLGLSVQAYKRFYQKVVEPLLAGEEVTITIG
jgi:hypothetical protein